MTRRHSSQKGQNLLGYMKEASTIAAFTGTPLQVSIVPSRNVDVYFSCLLLLSPGTYLYFAFLSPST